MPGNPVTRRVAVALGAVLCGALLGGGVSDTTHTSPSAVALAGSQTGAQDVLRPRLVTSRRGWDGQVRLFRAPDGQHLVTWMDEYETKTAYRLYDPLWEPVSPTYWIPAQLNFGRGTETGFVGRAERWNGSRYTFREWVRLPPDATDGRFDVLRGIGPTRRDPSPPEAGDLLLASTAFRPDVLYRPARDRVLLREMPGWYGVQQAWYPTVDGSVCSHRHGARSGTRLRGSVDEGRSWQRTPTTALPEASGPRLQFCITTAANTILVTGSSEYPRWVHTLEPGSGRVLSSHRLGTRLDPYSVDAFPDGTLLAGTNRKGVYLGTDPTNATLEFRPAPVAAYLGVDRLGPELVAFTSTWRAVNVSTDRGLTWRRVSLRFAER